MGDLAAIVRPLGNTCSFEHDGLRRLTKATDDSWGLSLSTRYEYDKGGNLLKQIDPLGSTTENSFDKLNRKISTTWPAAATAGTGTSATSQSLYGYDSEGNLTAETDEEGRVTSHEYDRQNRLTADIRTYRTGTGTSATSQSRYSYDAAGNRVSVTDPLGNKTETVYDEWNRAWKTINPLGFTSFTELDGAGNQTRTVDPRGNSRTWNRDQRGLVTGAIDAEGNETGYSYDENGNQTAITYANNSRTEISYDAEDRKGLITEAKGSPEERTSGIVQYDKVGNPLQVRDGNNNLTTTAYNSLNLPATVTDALGNSSSTSYYRTGKVKSSTNRRGAITTTDYDKLWRVIKVTDPLNQTISTSYDNVGNPRLATDKRGITSETIYDDLHRPVEKRRNYQRLASLEYDANNNLIAETDANNNRTVHAYDQLNRKISSTWPAVSTGTGTTSSSQSLYGYDENNNLIVETDEEGIITSHGYDRENRRTYTERAGEGTWHHFDKMGDLVAIVRPLGNTRSFEHDGLRRLTKATDDSWGLSLSTRYEYDKGGNLLKQIDPLGSTTENSFDKLNRKISTTWPAAATAGTGTSATSQSLYGYDSEGNLTAETDPKGQQISHSYDLLNRKTESRYPDTVISYSYDQNNNLLTANTSGSSTSNSYDNFDRLQSSTQQGITVSYSYDLNGNRTSVATPGQSTGYSYDARNRVATATANSTTTSFDYYKDGKRKTISYPNNTTETWDYYQSNRVKTIHTAKGGTTISQFDYSYDANGNRTSQIESGANRNKQTSYSFDSLDRMTGYSEDNGYQVSYTYNGYNRATETETFYGGDRTSKTYSYDNANQLTTIETSQTDSGGNITSTSRIDYGYDLNGNTISRTVTDGTAGTGTSPAVTSQSLYSYDSRNKLITVSTDGSTLGQNSYNAQGYRIRQQQSDRGDIDYLYDGTSVIEERTSNSLLAHYRYAGKLLALSTPQGNQYYHLDALGSTTDLTDDQGDIKASYHLDPWGSIEEITGDSINRRIFTGKETDQNTGLINIGVRYYDPETARFITQDSYLGKQDEPPSLHRYLYAYSNPTVYVDLEGYASIKANLNGMATFAANLFGDLILRNNESVPRLVNGKLISERKSYEVNFEGADPRKWVKTKTAEYDALAAYNKQLSDRGAIAKGALDYHTLGLSGMVTGNYDAVKGVSRSLSSLKRSFDSSLSEAEQNAASFEAGHEFLSSAIVLGTTYRAKPSVVRTVESKVGAAQAAVIEMESAGGTWVKKQQGIDEDVILKYKAHGDMAEFERQLAGQENGLNMLTAGEIKQNIEKYRAEGRPSSAQSAIKAARRQNPQAAKGQAGLHNPDACIGGCPSVVSDFGDKGINSSLGRQNGYKMDDVYNAVKDVPSAQKVNFKFIIDKDR